MRVSEFFAFVSFFFVGIARVNYHIYAHGDSFDRDAFGWYGNFGLELMHLYGISDLCEYHISIFLTRCKLIVRRRRMRITVKFGKTTFLLLYNLGRVLLCLSIKLAACIKQLKEIIILVNVIFCLQSLWA